MNAALAIGASAIILTAFCGPTSAEPGPVVRWLMKEPASLFDVGMIRLNSALREVVTPEIKRNLSKKALLVYLQAKYNWKNNAIILSSSASLTEKPTEKICKMFIDTIRNWGGVNRDGNRQENYGGYSAFFRHIQYKPKSAPKNVAETIDSIISIDVRLFSFYYRGINIHCQAPLLGTGYSVINK